VSHFGTWISNKLLETDDKGKAINTIEGLLAEPLQGMDAINELAQMNGFVKFRQGKRANGTEEQAI
jgi:hypothetical protein